MIKRRVFHISTNGMDDIYTIDGYDVFDENDLYIVIAEKFQTTRQYIKILSFKDSHLFVFSVMHYFLEAGHDITLSEDSFKQSLSDIQEKIQDIEKIDIFWLWLKQFSWTQITMNLKQVNTVIQNQNLPVYDIEQGYKEWTKHYESVIHQNQKEYNRLLFRMETLSKDSCPGDSILPFKIKKIRVGMTLPLRHSLYHYLDSIQISEEWCCAFYKNFVRYAPGLKIDHEILDEILSNREYNELMIYNRDMEQYISLNIPDTKDRLEVILDVRPFEDMNDIKKIVRAVLNEEPAESYRTLSVSGTFYIKNAVFEKTLWQDFLMNDETIGRYYFHINELEKATRYGENVTIHTNNNTITSILINDTNDTTPKPDILSQFKGRYVKVNVTRAKGNKDDVENINRFQKILCSILKRFASLYSMYEILYDQIIPSFYVKPLFPSISKEMEDTTNFANKYKYFFKKTGYKTSCAPPTRIPTIIQKEEALVMNPLKVLEYPKPNDPNIDIPTEYLTCTDPKYPFPGITSLGGGALFVPCCFNKNPRSSKAFLEYYTGKKVSEPKGTEHIKSEAQIIKTFGDVGKVPGTILQFLTSLMPDHSFFRVGTVDNSSSILHSLNYLKDNEQETDVELRRRIVKYFGTNINVCRQENPYKTTDTILSEIDSVDVYFDPRNYIRLLEIFFDMNIIVFVKSKKTEDIQMMTPEFELFYIRYNFVKDKPFVFLYEHWGTSPDRYTKRKYPVCEMIIGQHKDNRYRQFFLDPVQQNILSNVSKTVFRIFPLVQNVKNIHHNKNIVKQLIDGHGKLRGLYVLINDKYIYIESVNPLPPLFIPNEMKEEMKQTDLFVPSIEVLRSKINGIKILLYLSYDNKKYITFLFEGHEWKTQITSGMSLSSFQKTDHPVLLYQSPSRKPVSNLLRKQQVARMLMDYILYLYSLYGSAWRDHIRIVPNHRYSNELSELIHENPSFLTSNNILIISSESVLDKLNFTLEYNLRYHPDMVRDMKRSLVLPHFWENIYDFDNWKRILQIHVFERLQKESNDIYVQHGHLVDVNGTKGYWYNRDQRPTPQSDSPFRYIRVKDVEEAISMTRFWRKYKYIPGYKLDYVEMNDGIIVNRFINDEWSVKEDIEKEEYNPVYVFENKQGNMYVLLDIKN